MDAIKATTKRNGEPVFDINLFRTEENIQTALELMTLDSYKPIVATFGANKLYEARFGITATGTAFDDIIGPLEYYKPGGRHITDGGETPFQKEIYRNWYYTGSMGDRTQVRKGKADHWYLSDYQMKIPGFTCPVPEFRVREVKGLCLRNTQRMDEYIEQIEQRAKENIKLATPINTSASSVTVSPDPIQ